MQAMAVLREDGPSRSGGAAEPLPVSGTCTVTVRCLPEEHSVADVIKAAVVKARQANPMTSSMRDRFELVLRDGRHGEEAVAIGSHGPSSLVALPLAALHQAARSSDPALLARDAPKASPRLQSGSSSSSSALEAAGSQEGGRCDPAASRAARHIASLATAASHRGVLQVRRSLAANQLVREPEPDAVRVLTYNLLAPPKFRAARSTDKEFAGGPEVWLPRAQLQARVIAAASPDIVCLQELWRDSTLQHSGLRPAMQASYRVIAEASRPEAVDQVVMFVKREEVALREGRPALKLVEPSPSGLHPTTRLIDPDRRAVCAVAVLQATSSTGASYRICCAVMHLLFVPVRGSTKQLNFTRAARLKQAKYFKEQVLRFASGHGLSASAGDVVVMTGDINMEGGIGDKATMAESPDADVWAEFSSAVESPVLPECLRADARMPYPQIGGLARIPRSIVQDAAALPEGVWADLSDHRPVVADIHPPA